jgi:hypothetical protein
MRKFSAGLRGARRHKDRGWSRFSEIPVNTDNSVFLEDITGWNRLSARANRQSPGPAGSPNRLALPDFALTPKGYQRNIP